MRKETVSLTLILGLAFFLRIWGVGFGLPHLYHADEPIVVNHALAYGTGDLNPHFFKIPPLISYLLFVCYGIYFMAGRALGFFSQVINFEHLFYSDPTSFYLIARSLFGVLAGTASVYAWYRLLMRNFGVPVARLSALLMASCFLHVRDSHYIYADIPLIGVFILCFGILFRILDHPDALKQHLLAGGLIGLAAAVKYNGVFLLLPYSAVLLMSLPLRKAMRYGLMTLAISILSFVLLNPFALLDFPFFIREIQNQSAAQSGVGWLHHLRYSLWEGMGPPVLLFAFMGMIRTALSRNKKLLLMSFFILFYYLILCLTAQPYDRYVLPLVPFLVFFAADTIRVLGGRIQYCSRILRPGLLALVLLPGLVQSILFDRVMSAKDNRTLAKEWIESNIQTGIGIALGWDFLMPRLHFSKKQIAQKRQDLEKLPGYFSESQKRRLDYLSGLSGKTSGYDLFFLMENPDDLSGRFLFSKPVLPYDTAKLKEAGVQYVVVEMFRPTVRHLRFLEELSRSAVLMKEFNPYRNARREYAYDAQPLTGGPLMLGDLWLRERNGQSLRIYRLNS